MGSTIGFCSCAQTARYSKDITSLRDASRGLAVSINDQGLHDRNIFVASRLFDPGDDASERSEQVSTATKT